jgi:C4-dicarboxylate transporter, DctM subunit
VCAGATLGILIPPSVILVIYGIMTEQSIGALFAAGVLPGLLATASTCWPPAPGHPSQPRLGPARRAPPGRSARAPGRIWGVLLLFALVMGGMYGGFFTPTEAAGVGAMGGFLRAGAARADAQARCARCWWTRPAPRRCCSPSSSAPRSSPAS